ncbi:hypothetical protein [Uliginosibacterium sp. TH139]|uniref:hypothetical protein n=1 Tax=Uliginosibacterium sp. TH139 TaxID=2067453 RepID=UPI00117F3208|nr:hypothetical protein [Uliginosibacterium sp. TH139]
MDRFTPEAPTKQARLDYAVWYAKGVGAKSLCNGATGSYIDKCGNEDQTEAADAYLHYMNASGADRTIDYGKFLNTDSNGKKVRDLLIEDLKKHAEVIGFNRSSFQLTSEPYRVGGKDGLYPEPPLRSLYPATVNWQRAIGGHSVWVPADVQIDVDTSNRQCRIRHVAHITFHMEDMYNFNPGMADITTNIPDSENGRFQVVGLAKQYINRGTYSTVVAW